ncbi:MAG: N-acetyl-gamma-glutamyl-phosphate reductase [Gemmiger sp.]|nr:N-acetyl-gamma-glutamyl-phosphate reductase [Gemmiger sp.]
MENALPQQNYKIFIDGSAGTTGLRIADRLAARPEFTLLQIPEADRKNLEARAAAINNADLAFLCLPDAAAKEIIPLLRPDVRVLDTSTAHRTAFQTDPTWVYGLPELHGQRAAIRAASRVAVPGCYATGFITLVAPLVACGLLGAAQPLSCYGLSGYSGAGKSGIAQYTAPGRDAALQSPRPYGLNLTHKHLPEMQAVCGLAEPPVFCPVVDDYYAGMEVTVPLHPAQLGHTAEELAAALAEYYQGEGMVTVHPLNTAPGFLPANTLAGKDTLEIYPTASPDGKRMLLISLFDNLGKGSSGAAVQCMNLMLGLPEGTGLV